MHGKKIYIYPFRLFTVIKLLYSIILGFGPKSAFVLHTMFVLRWLTFIVPFTRSFSHYWRKLACVAGVKREWETENSGSRGARGWRARKGKGTSSPCLYSPYQAVTGKMYRLKQHFLPPATA